jgi:DNA-binding NarL/FixJ family response regulator
VKSRLSLQGTPGADSPKGGAPRKKIFIIEHDPIFRENLRIVLNQEQELTVIGEASALDDALKAIPRLDPDLVLADISSSRKGPELVKALRALNRKTRLLVISAHAEAVLADRVLRAGADGYILKHEDPEEVAGAIHDVLAGHIYVSEEVLTRPKKAPKRRTKS